MPAMDAALEHSIQNYRDPYMVTLQIILICCIVTNIAMDPLLNEVAEQTAGRRQNII